MENKWVYLLSVILLLIGQAISPTIVSAKKMGVRDSGIQVGIDMTNPINSQQKVTTTVSIQGSEGDMSTGSTVTVDIPASIVRGGIDDINLEGAKLQGFDGPTIKKVGDHYELVYVKNDESVAGGEQATISWTSPDWNKGEEPGTVESTVEYKDAQDSSKNTSASAQSDTKGTISPQTPDFAKWTTMAQTNDIPGYTGVALMNPKNTSKNIYQLPVNYAQKHMKNAIVTDTLPADTHFVTPNVGPTVIEGVKISQVTGSGFVDATNQFASGIKVSGRTLSVNLGDAMANGTRYVIEYAVAPDEGQTPASYGVKVNNASLSYTDDSGKKQTIEDKHNQSIDDNSNGAFTFTKKVKQTEYLMGSKYLDYTIQLTNDHNFLIPAGSIIEDPLPDGLSYVSTDASSVAVSLKPTIEGQNVKWSLSKSLDTGESAIIHFRVKVDESKFQPGQEIHNQAILHRTGSKDLSSNATTVLVFNGKIKINKTDAKTGKELAGAKFDIINSDGKVVDHVTTGEDGTIISHSLPSGDYTVKEVKAPDGYEISNQKYTVHLDYQHSKNGIVSIDIQDIPSETNTTDTTSSTDTTDTTDTTSSTDTTDTTSSTSTTDTTSSTDTTDTTSSTSTTDTTSSTGTTDTTSSTSTTDTTSSTSTTDTTSSTSTTDTTSSTGTTDTTSSTGTTDTTSSTGTTDTTSSTEIPGKDMNSSSKGTSESKHSSSDKSSENIKHFKSAGSKTDNPKGPKSPLTSLLPQTGEKGNWILTATGVALLGVVGWFIFRKKH
ncbi:SpaA isopeptide-forming pilin-related protein [Pediococcus pentosaceus]|uniref:SpaA isopeptide-forming pilin-related protein n=1 Tax=Pediococcus pentosaceus TaxID=1255 RepID=UPI0020171A55|nr:SpaA isopeptide-forming pilin-related protein [Pediococcus pentosaceus]MCL3859362.1 SpaA isopeptide-forming pilin-related protein [Pediococcus pentosaceus]